MEKNSSLIFPQQEIMSSAASAGAFCLTFDDRYFEHWEKAIPLFEKYHAHTTFFISGTIDDTALKTMKTLQDAGHSIGLHSISHPKLLEYLQENSLEDYMKNEIAPQLEICRENGIFARAFAYPCSQRNPETDDALFQEFDFLRTSWLAGRMNVKPVAEVDACFVKSVAPKQLFHGFSSCGNFDMADAKNAMNRAVKENAVLVFYAHDITENICPSHHIAVSQLTELLAYAETIGLTACGLNEL